MALERRNPIPPGYYWQDAFGRDVVKMQTWLKSHRDSVSVIASVPYTDQEGVWTSFQVKSPTTNDGFPGFPTILDSPDTKQEETSTGAEVAEKTREAYEKNPFRDVTDPVAKMDTGFPWGKTLLLVATGVAIVIFANAAGKAVPEAIFKRV